MQLLLVRSISNVPKPNRTKYRMGTYSSDFCLVLCPRFLSLSEDELSRRRLARRTNKSGNFVVVVVVVVEVVVVLWSSEFARDVKLLFSVATSLVTPSVEDTATDDDGVVVVVIRLERGGLVLTGVWRGLVGFDRGELHFLRSGVHALDCWFLKVFL